jgi:protein phosphatase
MSNPLTIQCANPACLHPDNALGQQVCDRCQSPLVYVYLWATGADAAQIIPGMRVDDRYVVMAPQVWLDTQPGQPPAVPAVLPDRALPYLHLYPQRLHLPEIYGFQQQAEDLLLLRSAIDPSGKLLPALGAIWAQVSSVRQVNWFWQLMQLWTPLAAQGVAASLLLPENLRVEGWRVRLLELYADRPDDPPSLKQFASVWQTWISKGDSPVVQPLQAIFQQIQTANSEAGLQTAAAQLNQLLLTQAAQQPLRLKIVSASTTGPQRSHNEDACYPPPAPVRTDSDPIVPQLAIVCDGIGGHAGGEVASQLAVRSLQLQIRALLAEVIEQTELMTPEVVTQQLEAIVRVVNNLIASQNDTQKRESRQRMGTTLVMALQLPQQVIVPQQVTASGGVGNSHELYLVHVGDSRAYWLTPRYCHLLTVDDDVAAREVRLGRSLYEDALRRSDSGALTQALGTRDADYLHPTVQRFVLEEDGLLLLCSDGLSDNQVIEQSWEESTQQIFKNKMTLEAAVQSWIDRANQRNGHDNTSVVMLHCQVSPESPQLFEPPPLPDTEASELSESSRALLYGEAVAETAADQPSSGTADRSSQFPRRTLSPWAIRAGSAVLLLAAGILGIVSWQQLDPAGFDRTWQRIFQTPPVQPPASEPANPTPASPELPPAP